MLLVTTEGVPLIVHVLLSMDRPVGRAGETVHVAPVTLVMPLPEPLLSPVEESQVLLPATKTGKVEMPVMPKPPSPNLPPSAPQHFASPLSRIAQVWPSPVEIATAVRPVPRSMAVELGA